MEKSNTRRNIQLLQSLARRLFLTFAILSWVFPALAGEVGTVTYTEGRVDVRRPGAIQVIPLREDEPIFVGDILRTKSNSKAEVKFRDNSIVRMAQNSKIEISDYLLTDDNLRQSATINLFRGKIRTIIAKMPQHNPFNIITPNAKGTVKGSDIFAFYQAGNSGMFVLEGQLSVINLATPSLPVIVPPGNSILVPQSDLPQGPREYFELEKKFYEKDTNPPLSREQRNLGILKGTVTKTLGDVRIISKGEKTPHPAQVGDLVKIGDRIETGDDGFVEIKLDNGNAVSLKNNTDLLAVKLFMNPNTSQYENLFKVSMGKIRARIENLKAGSSFKIKTPTAISGARGTIMYAEISKESTRTFFEGGTGFITNLLSGKTEDINPGQNAYADDEGKLSRPVDTTREERIGFAEGWDPGSGIEGYSPPEGTNESYLYYGDTGTGAGEGTDEGNTDLTGGTETADANKPDETIDEYLGTPPVTETVGTTPATTGTSTSGQTPEPEPQPQPEPASGNFTAHFGYFDLENSENYLDYGSMDGNLQTTAAPWTEPVDVTISGPYVPPQPPNQDRDKLWASSSFLMTDSDGSVSLSIVGGTNTDNELNGILYGLYIRPDGSTGYLKSSLLNGNFNPGNQTFSASGTLGAYDMGITSVLPADLEQNLQTDLITQTAISGDILGLISNSENTLSLRDQNWNIWKLSSGGTYLSLLPDDWQAHMVWKERNGDLGNAYTLVNLQGDLWADNKLQATVHGQALSDSNLVEIHGRMLGVYDDAGQNTWEALSAGVSTETPLTFNGIWGGEETGGLYGNNAGAMTYAGEAFGLIGAVTSPWNNPQPFLAMGEYAGEQTEPLLFNAPFYSYTYGDGGRYSTFDVGGFWGFAAGTSNDEGLRGSLAAFYMAPTQTPGVYTAGYMRGTSQGNYYSDVGFWQNEGTLTPYEQTANLTGINPDEFTYMADNTGVIRRDNDIIYGRLSGRFDNGGTIAGYARGYTYFIPDPQDATGERDLPWEILNLNIENYEGYSNTYSNPQATWSGVMGGKDESEGLRGLSYWLTNITDGRWDNSRINATMTGEFMSAHHSGPLYDGDILLYNGDIWGIYDDDGTWVGSAIGVEEHRDMRLIGVMNGYFTGYDSRSESMQQSGSFNGLIGTVDPLFSDSPLFTMLGEYDNPDNRSIWENQADIVTQKDNVAFRAMIGGILIGRSADGLSYALYIREDSPGVYRAGYFKSTNIFGNFYEDIGMFEGNGNFTSSYASGTEFPTAFSPADLSDGSQALVKGNTEVGLVGSPFLSGGFTWNSMEIVDQSLNFDIWKTTLGGSFVSQPGNEWNAVMGFSSHNNDSDYYWIEHLNGNTWADGKLKGTMIGQDMRFSKDPGAPNVGRIISNEGDFIGTYGTSDWQAVGLGSESGKRYFQFAGNYDGQFGVYNPQLGIVDFNYGSLSAISGGLTPFYSGTPQLTIMGEFTNTADYSLWGAANQFNFQGRTLDGGALLGSIGGIHLNGSLEALFYALYIRPDGDGGYLAGYIKSTDITGNYYSSINMFEANGTLTSYYNWPTDVRPEELFDGSPALDQYADAEIVPFGGNLLSGQGEIIGETLIGDQDWGIIRVSAGGTYTSEPDNAWQGVMGFAEHDTGKDFYMIWHYNGNTWSEGKLSGSISGGYINWETPEERGDMTLSDYGDFMGTYAAGQWQSIGFVAGSPENSLQFGSHFTGSFGYYDDPDLMRDGSLAAILGGKDNPWAGSTPFTIMGEFDNPSNYSLWANGDAEDNIMGRTVDGGSFLGTIGGIAVNHSVEALFGAFYIRPNPSGTGNLCGYLWSGNLTGNFYPGIGMFEANGTMTKYLDRFTEYSPAQLYDNSPVFLSGADMEGNVTGNSFQGTLSSESAEIKNQTWGLWRSASGGTYHNPPDAGWNAHMAARLTDEASGQLIGYSSGNISGEAWQNNKFSSGISGYWLSQEDYGYFSGNGIGTYTNGTWEMISLGFRESRDDLSPDYLTGTQDAGQFNVNGGGEITEQSLTGRFLNIPGENGGLFSLMAQGTYTLPISDDWQIFDLTGLTETTDSSYVGGSWMGGITGSKWNPTDAIEGELNALWIQLRQDGTLSARTMTGEVDGSYIEVDTQGTWQAASAGEWVEVSDISDLTGPIDDVVELSGPANIPITEVYNSLLTGTGVFGDAGGTLSITAMNMDFYTMGAAADGIWAAMVNGNYSAPTSNDWTLNASGNLYDSVSGSSEPIGTVNATLTGTSWTGGNWQANVNGNSDTGITLTGVSGGTYTPSDPTQGTFSGAGTGTFEIP